MSRSNPSRSNPSRSILLVIIDADVAKDAKAQEVDQVLSHWPGGAAADGEILSGRAGNRTSHQPRSGGCGLDDARTDRPNSAL